MGDTEAVCGQCHGQLSASCPRSPALGSQYSPKPGCPWYIRSGWLHPCRTLYLILLFLPRPRLFFFFILILHEQAAWVSFQMKTTFKKWNEGGGLGRSPEGSPLSIFDILWTLFPPLHMWWWVSVLLFFFLPFFLFEGGYILVKHFGT